MVIKLWRPRFSKADRNSIVHAEKSDSFCFLFMEPCCMWSLACFIFKTGNECLLKSPWVTDENFFDIQAKR